MNGSNPYRSILYMDIGRGVKQMDWVGADLKSCGSGLNGPNPFRLAFKRVSKLLVQSGSHTEQVGPRANPFNFVFSSPNHLAAAHAPRYMQVVQTE